MEPKFFQCPSNLGPISKGAENSDIKIKLLKKESEMKLEVGAPEIGPGFAASQSQIWTLSA